MPDADIIRKASLELVDGGSQNERTLFEDLGYSRVNFGFQLPILRMEINQRNDLS
jgi:hypothetical protein